ncbi:hypothetical protein ARTHRO9AX_130052 [Arthrobacter sp. 9AX]|nr:hypothetical protein ARTHRO9AX_130052 [Arthrobacter sp. 9AX]
MSPTARQSRTGMINTARPGSLSHGTRKQPTSRNRCATKLYPNGPNHSSPGCRKVTRTVTSNIVTDNGSWNKTIRPRGPRPRKYRSTVTTGMAFLTPAFKR